ncbi:MAG: response regulator transcription factor [Verrucomicrobiales bacterium]|nr:response regulator transcription factor [Verrucomicrobiales bacterium]
MTGINDLDETSPVVWIIEDHPLLRESVCDVIRSEITGNVFSFQSCRHALDSTTKDGGLSPDAMILDIGLPDISGIEGITLFKERFPDTDIIMFTVFDDEARIFEAIAAGASGYLLKSESLNRIADAIREVLAGGRPMTPEIARLVLERFSRLAPSPTSVELSERELETLRHLVEGLAKKEIAVRLGISLHTVDTYVRRIYKKLQVNTLGGAVAKALREGIV